MDPFSRWPNLAAMMLGLAAERASQPMLRHWQDGAWASLTWGDFARQVAAVAHSLASCLPPGAPVLLVSDSRPEVPIANVALQAIGAIPVPAYVTNLPSDHAHLLHDSGARTAIVATAALAQRVLAAGPLDLLICLEPFSSPACPVVAWSTLIAAPAPLDAIVSRAAAIDREAIAVLMYTSGTGGAPRGVKLPHRAILSNCAGAAEVVQALDLAGTTYLSILPLAHAYEYTVGQYFLSAIGCEVVFARGIETLAADMLAIRPDVMTVVPRLLEVIRARIRAELARQPAWRRKVFALAERAGQRRQDRTPTLPDRLLDPVLDRLVRARVRARFGGQLIAIVCGGARLDPAIGRFFLAMGLRILQGYGQTEAGPVISVNPLDAIRVDTVGPPLRGVDVRIAGDGEILVRGDLVMAGYHNRPAETAAAIEDGWLHTGDIGELTDGYLKITDRKKDIIVLSGGQTISPARIESLLMEQPEIAQAVVHGEGAAGLSAFIVPAETIPEIIPAAILAALARVNASLATPEKLRRHQLVPPFTVENGLLTASQKIRRHLVIRHHAPAANQSSSGTF